MRTPERIWASGDKVGSWNDQCVDAEVEIEYVRADLYARLQEQVETLTRERDEALSGNRYAQLERLAIARAEAAEAREDRLREALDKIAEADFEQSKSELHDFVTDIALAALQKETRP